MDFAHSLGIANRDLKLENTLLEVVRTTDQVTNTDTGAVREVVREVLLVKLCDFGCAAPRLRLPTRWGAHRVHRSQRVVYGTAHTWRVCAVLVAP